MAELLAVATAIPIAQLTPDLHAPSTRFVRAIVTLIWPYSSSTSTLKVLLADPDFRLRRTRGQVLVQFSGSSARSVFEAGIGSGDEVILSLDGVDWTKDKSAGQTPGRSIDWELKFSERLVLKIQQNETDKSSLVDIDHPILIPEPEVIQDIPELELLASPPKATITKASRPGLTRSETNEWSSPAFVKRARVSYGSLFESSYDIFAEEDGTVHGKGRKRARFGRKSGSWRYSSRSQSPERSQTDENVVNSGFLEPYADDKPMMTGEGCQTLGLEDDNAAEALADLSRQQVTPVDNSIVLENRPGTFDISVSGPLRVLDRSELSVETQHPPITHVALQAGIQQESTVQQPPIHSIKPTLAISDTNMAPSDTLLPLDQSSHIAIETTHPTGPLEIEDLYGLSPTADGYPRNATPEANFDHAISNRDDPQSILVDDLYKHAHQVGDYHDAIAYPKLPSHPTSPEEAFGSTFQVYPEPDVAGNPDFTTHSGPYYGERLQDYLRNDGDHLLAPSEGQWDVHLEDVRSPNTNPLAEHEMSRGASMQKLLARRLSPGAVTMSRSQSGHSEMIDLTEDSEEEGEGFPESWQTGDEEETNEQVYRKGQIKDQSGDEEEGYESLLYNNDRSESTENEVDYDDEINMRRPPEFHPVKHLAPGEVADDGDDDEQTEFVEDETEEEDEVEVEEETADEDVEEERSYDDESVSGEEDASAAIKQPAKGEPQVIDLLSSDEENGGEENASRDPSELGESVTKGRNGTYSMFAKDEESDLEAETDVENSEEEANEDTYAEGDPLKESHYAKPVTMKELEGLLSQSVSDEDETENMDGIESPENGSGLALNAEDTSGSFEDVQFHTKKQKSTTHSPLTSLGGHDGTSDGPDHPLVAPKEVEEVGTTANVNGNEVPMSGDATSSVLPIGNQEKSAQLEDTSIMSKNDQLPTPDATQLSAGMAPDTSFGSTGSFHQSLEIMDFTKHIIRDTQDSRLQEPIDGVEEVSSQISVDGSIPSTRKDAARDAFIEDTAVAVDEYVGVVAEMEARDVNGKGTTRIRADAAQEISIERAPRGAPNVTANVAKGPMIEGIHPAPITPRRSKRLSFSHQRREMLERSPSTNLDEPATPDDYDASVELAMAALDSPSKQDTDEQNISDRQMRVMLSRPLRTSLGDFTTLKLVRFNLEKKLDVLAIVTQHPSEPQRAKSGLRHYHLRFTVTDATIAPSGVISANIFRPYKTALPSVIPGEVVLLRNFLVKSEKGAGFTLRSDEGSSWVVFKHGGVEEVKGPPVEYGGEERDHVAYLKVWYRSLDLIARERIEKASGDKGSEMARSMGKAF